MSHLVRFYVRFEAFAAVTMKNASSWMLRGVALVKTDVSEESSTSIIFLRSMRRLLVTANVVSSTSILVTLMKELIRSSETSVLSRATRRHIKENSILHSHCRENIKSYIALSGWTLAET
jgi:hypothetical protein